MKLPRLRLTLRRMILAVMVVAILMAVVARAFVFRADSRTLVIRVETIQDGDGIFRGRWTFTSGRRWDSFGIGTRSGEHFLVLDQPGSLDAGPVRFIKGVMGQGADRIVYEIESRLSPGRAGTGPAEVTTRRALLGNARGTPAFSNIETTPMPAGPWQSPFQTIQSEGATIPLPAKVRLGVVGGMTEVIEFR